MLGWRFLKLLLVLVLPGLMVACGSIPENVVVLLPNDDGSVGKIEVTNAGQSETLSKANQASGLGGAGQAPGQAFTVSQDDVNRIFGRAIAAQPEPPERFVLYFKTDTTELTEQSARQLPKILTTIRRRSAPEVDVSGHTDKFGTKSYNVKFARNRAEVVRDKIVEIGVQAERVTVSSHGENNPLMPTPDGVREPLNRRVEVVVR